jgi:acyl-CoA dehydrogenase
MPTYSAPVRDTLFVLNDVLGYGNYDNLPGFADASPDIVEAILSEGAKLAENVMQPLNRTGDIEGCTRHEDGSVTTAKAAGWAFPCLQNTAARASPTRCTRPSANIWFPPIWR